MSSKTVRRGRFLIAAALMSGAVAVTGCGDAGVGGAQGDSKGVQLGLAVKNDMDNSPLVIAKDKGIFKEYGLDVSLVYFDGGGALVQAMAGGKVGYGWVSHAPVIKANEEGVPLKIIGEVSKTAIGWGLVARPDSPIKTVKDIKPGMKISYTSEGALTQWYAQYVAKQAGLKPDQVKGVPIGTSLPAIKTALEKKQIDAATVLLPWGDLLTKEGAARWVSHMDKELPEFSFTGIPATEDAIKNEKQTSCLIGAYTAAVRWMADHPQETQQFMQKFYSVDREVAKSAYERLVPDFNKTAEMDPARMQFVIDSLKSVPGFIEGSATPDDVLTKVDGASKAKCGKSG